MSTDLHEVLARGAARPTHAPDVATIWEGGRRRRARRNLASGVAALVIAGGVTAGVLTAVTGDNSGTGSTHVAVAPDDTRTIRDAAHGLSIEIPPSWQAAPSTLTPVLSDPIVPLAVGTYPLDDPQQMGECDIVPQTRPRRARHGRRVHRGVPLPGTGDVRVDARATGSLHARPLHAGLDPVHREREGNRQQPRVPRSRPEGVGDGRDRTRRVARTPRRGVPHPRHARRHPLTHAGPPAEHRLDGDDWRAVPRLPVSNDSSGIVVRFGSGPRCPRKPVELVRYT